jgi:hypothetical protein
MEVCVILTRTSPGFGGATRISSTDKGSPALYATAATQNTMIPNSFFRALKKTKQQQFESSNSSSRDLEKSTQSLFACKDFTSKNTVNNATTTGSSFSNCFENDHCLRIMSTFASDNLTHS